MKFKKKKVLSRTGKKYRSDSEFNEKQKENMRKRYRKAHNVTFSGPEQSLKFLKALGHAGFAMGDTRRGLLHDFILFNYGELAEALQLSRASVWRWIAGGRLPPPTIMEYDIDGKYTGKEVYTINEVTAIVNKLTAHLKKYKYYRNDHKNTIDTVFNSVYEIRNNLTLKEKEREFQ